MDRRQLLVQLFQSGSIMTLAQVSFVSEMLASSLLGGIIKKAAADELKMDTSINYLNIGMLGAPMRYQFDHWLRTNANDPSVMPNSITGTKYIFKDGKVVGTELGYFDHNGVLVPNLFSQSAELSSGVFNFSEILKHMVVIRGFGSGLDGHPTNFIRQHSPLGGASSIAALAAEDAKRTFDVIQWPNRQGWSNYFSKGGKTINVLTGNDPAGTLLSGFGPPGGSLSTARTVAARNQEVVNLAKSRLMYYIKSEAPGSKILAKNHSGAVDLIKKGVANFTDYWAQAVARYNQVIENAIRATGQPGISEAPIQLDPTAPWQGHHKELTEAQRQNLFAIGSGTSLKLKFDWDLRDAVKTATTTSLGTGIAIAEYIFAEKLGNSIEIRSEALQNLALQPREGEPVTGYTLDHDMHLTGAAVAPFLMNQYYRGLLAGVSELQNRLKQTTDGGKTIWSKTMVHVVSDFERSARSDGAGSDHGFNQMVQSVIGGHITDGPHVVGNVRKNGTSDGYRGSQGFGAAIAGYNQSGIPTQTMAASTVASLLKVSHNPYENVADSLCEIENEKVKIKYPPKIIEDT